MISNRKDKKGISLIVLVITITSTYDEANKTDKIPPENEIATKIKLTKTDKVAEFKSAALLLKVNVV